MTPANRTGWTYAGHGRWTREPAAANQPLPAAPALETRAHGTYGHVTTRDVAVGKGMQAAAPFSSAGLPRRPTARSDTMSVN